MLDEVQTGNGRTGKYFAFQHEGVQPDVLTTAKGLGNGVPIGACLVAKHGNHIFGPGNHGSTYGGNPLVCAAALAVYDTIHTEELMANAMTRGQQIREGLTARFADLDAFIEVRGKGLMIGCQFNTDIAALAKLASDNQLLLNVNGGGKVIRLLPPLIISESEAEQLIETVSELVHQLLAK
jgi:acetylornithine aminotransferase